MKHYLLLLFFVGTSFVSFSQNPKRFDPKKDQINETTVGRDHVVSSDGVRLLSLLYPWSIEVVNRNGKECSNDDFEVSSSDRNVLKVSKSSVKLDNNKWKYINGTYLIEPIGNVVKYFKDVVNEELQASRLMHVDLSAPDHIATYQAQKTETPLCSDV